MNTDRPNIDNLLNSALASKGWIDTLPLLQLFEEKIEQLGIS